MDVIYYHCFVYFSKKIKDTDPHLRTCFALSVAESIIPIGIIDVIALKYYCYKVEIWMMFSVFVVICAFNCWVYIIRGKGKEVIGNKPLYFNNKRFSVVFTILFFLITFSWLFWGSIYGKYLLDNCR